MNHKDTQMNSDGFQHENVTSLTSSVVAEPGIEGTQRTGQSTSEIT